MLGVIALCAFGMILFSVLFDPEERMPLAAALPLLVSTITVGVNETWANFVSVDGRGIRRVHWAGFTYQHVALGDITGVYRQDERSWFGRERPYIVIESAGEEIHLGINLVYRDGGWPVQALAEVVVALAQRGAPVDAALLADSYAVTG